MSVLLPLKNELAILSETQERENLLEQFLEKHGLEEDELLPLPVDASKRRYFWFSHTLVMDAAPPHEDTKAFENITNLLREAGLTVPKIYAADHKNGFMLLEDFGDLTYRKALEASHEEFLIYKEAINALAHLHKKMKKNKADLPSYDLDLFLERVSLFTQWSDLALSQGAKEDFVGLWMEAFQNQPAVPQRLILRDVMVDNLFWLPKKEGYKRCGFIDYQDARWGPVTYDLVSLLEDARRDVAPDLAQSMLKVYFSHFPKLAREDFMASYCLWGAQRSTRILGVFSRLAKRDGKPKYLEHVPRIWAYLERDLQHPSLAGLKDWFEKVRI
ncbi:MAG: phosphotransferase [Alphaproteobacteria bacterium]|nr:phosphotransferase [Alphaproteobacteria bacterium]